jgi:hypothetical protein
MGSLRERMVSGAGILRFGCYSFFFIAVIFRFTAVVLIADERYMCCCLIALTTLLYCSQDKAVKISRSEIEIEFLQEAFFIGNNNLPTPVKSLFMQSLY